MFNKNLANKVVDSKNMEREANCSKGKMVDTNCIKNMEREANCSKGKVVDSVDLTPTAARTWQTEARTSKRSPTAARTWRKKERDS